MVSRQCTPSALARRAGSVCDMALRDHAAADARSHSDRPLRRISAAVSNIEISRRGRRSRRARAMERLGLLSASTNASSRSAVCTARVARQAPAYSGGAAYSSRRGRLHGGGGRQHCIWRKGCGAGRQCRARFAPVAGSWREEVSARTRGVARDRTGFASDRQAKGREPTRPAITIRR